jgi:Uncharacterized membrane protein (homolog of Drosophila rhomboid)
MEIQHIFLFVAVASALLNLLQTIRARAAGPRNRAFIVLLGSAIAWVFVRPIAGYIAAVLWCALLLLPATLAHRRRPDTEPYHRWHRVSIDPSPVVLTLVVLNIVIFLIEIFAGGPQNSLTLYRLGELDTISVLYAHQNWRIITALFLHYGFLHLLFNMFALVVLGPPLERQIGSTAFAVCYLLSGIGSSVLMILLVRMRLLPPLQLVGASGCIMGIVGTWAGFLLPNRHTPLAGHRLRNVVLIIALQIAFDLVTPDVSMTAHLGGLFTGFLLGLALPRSRRGM